MRNVKKPTGQTARWPQELGTYNLKVTHRSGKKHSNADALSRSKSCTKQESGNQESDHEDDDDDHETSYAKIQTEIVRVCTRSQSTPDKNSKNSYVLDGWEPSTIRQKQLEDLDISLLLITKEEGKPRPAWEQIF